jgi:flagella basal body P-ring formation protein FlgA
VIVMLTLLALAVALTGPVPEAIERSIQARLGEVRVAVLEMSGAEKLGRFDGARVRECEETKVPACEGLTALPEAGARLGRPMRFVLAADGVRVGTVVATLEVTGPAVRARRAIARGEDVDSAAVDVVDTELTTLVLRRLPGLDEVVGAQARRDIAEGELLTDALVLAPPAVRSGDEVRISVTAGSVEVTSVGRASGSGRVGDIVRVRLPTSRTLLRVRITGPGSVEVVR